MIENIGVRIAISVAGILIATAIIKATPWFYRRIQDRLQSKACHNLSYISVINRYKNFTTTPAILTVIGASAGIVIIGILLVKMDPLRIRTTSATSHLEGGSPRPEIFLQVTQVPLSTPTPIPPLGLHLKEALAHNDVDSRECALVKVAQDAVILTDYWTAIRAIGASRGIGKDLDLFDIGECAVEDGKYLIASEIAVILENQSSQDELRSLITDARQSASLPDVPSSPYNRQAMDCLPLWSVWH